MPSNAMLTETPKEKPTLFPLDHWSRDWHLLLRIRNEFNEFKTRFNLGPEPKGRQLDTIWKEAFSPPEAYPALKEITNRLLDDSILTTSLMAAHRSLNGSLQAGFPFFEIETAIKIRLATVIWRGAESWLKSRSIVDLHWARFWNERMLKVAVARTIAAECDLVALKSIENHPTSEIRTDHYGRTILRPEELIDNMPLGIQSLSSTERTAYRYWYSKTGTIEEEQIAEELGITEQSLNEIIRKVHTESQRLLKKRNGPSR